MKREKIFRFNFDVDKVYSIRKVLDEYSEMLSEKTKSNKVTIDNGKLLGKKKSFKTKLTDIPALDIVWTCLHRIEDTLEYINSLKLATKAARNRSAAFDFYDFINSMYIVVDCIKTLGVIFCTDQSKIKEIERSTECFEYTGVKGEGSDNDFFEYIRSLTSVHPVDTGFHPAYHGKGKVHCCPFVRWGMNTPEFDEDLIVEIYTPGERTLGTLLYLRISEFANYLNKWIDFMDEVRSAISENNTDFVTKYQEQIIAKETDFSSYDKYIENLRNVFIKREGSYPVYILEDYQKIFELRLSNSLNEQKFDKYKEAIKYSLKFLHKRLQEMNKGGENSGIIYPEENSDTQLYIELWRPDYLKTKKNFFRYVLEKLDLLENGLGYQEFYVRTLLDRIKEEINHFVMFENTESAFETRVLISMALYFESLEFPNILNKNIPNDLKYRERLYTEEEWEKLVRNK